MPHKKYPVLPANPELAVNHSNFPYVVPNIVSSSLNPQTVEPIAFYRYLMPKDGDCGYHVLGIPRTIVVKQLYDNVGDLEIRAMVGAEIEASLQVGDLPANMQNLACVQSLNKLKDSFVTANETLDEILCNVKQHLEVNYSTIQLSFSSQLLSRLTADEMVKLLERTGRENPEEKNLFEQKKIIEDQQNLINKLKKDISDKSQTPDLFVAYVQHYIAVPGNFLTFLLENTSNQSKSSLDAIAKINHLNIKIWCLDASNSHTLKLLHHFDSNASDRTVNMFYQQGHFDSLQTQPGLTIKPVTNDFWENSQSAVDPDSQLNELAELIQSLEGKSFSEKDDKDNSNKNEVKSSNDEKDAKDRKDTKDTKDGRILNDKNNNNKNDAKDAKDTRILLEQTENNIKKVLVPEGRPSYKIETKKLNSKSDQEKLQIIVHALYEHGQSKIIYQGSHPVSANNPILKKKFDGFEHFAFTIDSHGNIELDELDKNCNLALSITGDISFSKKTSTSGWIDIQHANRLHNKTSIHADKGFYCKANRLKNRGVIKSKIIQVLRQGGHSSDCTLDNAMGKIVASQMLDIQAGTINNQLGKIWANQAIINAASEVWNQHGTIYTKQHCNLIAIENIKNQHGIIDSEKGNISVQSHTGQVICTDYGKIQSGKLLNLKNSVNSVNFSNSVGSVNEGYGTVSVKATKIVTDENSLIRGSAKTEICGQDRLRQESVVGGAHVSLQSSKNLDLQGGVVASEYVKINGKNQKLKLKKILSGRLTQITARDLELQDNLVGSNAKLNLTGKLKYKENTFQLNDLLSISLKEAQDIVSSIILAGSFHLQIAEKTKPLYILAPISAGIDKSKKLRHVKIMAEGVPVRIGKEGAPYVAVSATGKMEQNVGPFTVENGLVSGGNGVSVVSSGKAIVGRLTTKESERLCGLLSGGDLSVAAQDEILLQKSSMICHGNLNLKSPKPLNNVGGNIQVNGDACIDTPKFTHQIQTESDVKGLKVLSRSAEMQVSGKLKVAGEWEIIGSTVNFKNFEGKSPKLTTITPVQIVTKIIYRLVGVANMQGIACPRLETCFSPPIHSLFSSGTELTLVKPVLDLTGIIFVPHINLLNVQKGSTIGFTINIALPAAPTFKQIIPLLDYLQPNAAHVFCGPNSYTVMRSILPKMIKISLPPITVLTLDGSLTENNERLGCILSNDLNAEALVSAFMKELKRGILDAETTDPQMMLYRLMENAQTLMREEQNKAIQHAASYASASQQMLTPLRPSNTTPKKSAWLETMTKPILIYMKTDFEGKPKLSPHLILPPSWNNSKLRDYAGGLFSIGNILIRGESKESSTLRITAHLDAGGNIKISELNQLTLEKRMHHQQQQIADISTKKSRLGRNKNECNVRDIDIYTQQAGGTCSAGDSFVVDDVANTALKGCEISAGEKGVLIRTDNLREDANVSTCVTQHSSKDKSRWSKVSIHQNVVNPTINPTTINSEGPIDVETKKAELNSLEASAKKDIIVKSKDLKLGATKVQQALPTQVKASKSKIHITTGQTEIGASVKLKSERGRVACSGDTIQSVATQVMGKEGVFYLAKYRLVQEPLILTETRNKKTSGMNGLKLIKVNVQQRNQSGICSTSISEKNIKMEVTDGDMVLVAPILLAFEKIDLLTPKGKSTLKPATFHNDITSKQHSMGLSFFGSSAVEAAMRSDFRSAAKNMLREFPILGDMENLLKSYDFADTIGNGTKALFSIYKTYSAFAEASSLTDFLRTQIDTNIKIRFGKDKDSYSWEELALPWMQAREINIVAKEIDSKGLKANCEEFKAVAEKNASFTAAEAHSHSTRTSAGISPGYDIVKNMPSLSVDYSKTNTRALEYIHSHINASKRFTVIAGGALSLKGIFVETSKAVLEAENCTLETLQDTSHTTNLGASASTLGQVSMSKGKHDKKFAKEQTGIHARESLLVNIKKELNIIGAVLNTGQAGKTETVRTSEGETIELYELELPRRLTLDLLRINPSEIQKHEREYGKNPKIKTILYDYLVMWLQNNTLPEALQNEQTLGWQRILSNEPCNQAAQNEIFRYLERPGVLTNILMHVLPNISGSFKPQSNVSRQNANGVEQNAAHSSNQYSNDPNWIILSFISKFCASNIRIWEKNASTEELNITANFPSGMQTRAQEQSQAPISADNIDLCYSAANKTWTILNKQPGLIMADQVKGQAVVDKEKSYGFSAGVDFSGYMQNSDSPVKGMGDVDLRTGHKERVNNATISENNTIKAKQCSGIQNDLSKSQVQTVDSSHHFRAVIPMCNPFKTATDMKETFTRTPKMFKAAEVGAGVSKEQSNRSRGQVEADGQQGQKGPKVQNGQKGQREAHAGTKGNNADGAQHKQNGKKESLNKKHKIQLGTEAPEPQTGARSTQPQRSTGMDKYLSAHRENTTQSYVLAGAQPEASNVTHTLLQQSFKKSTLGMLNPFGNAHASTESGYALPPSHQQPNRMSYKDVAAGQQVEAAVSQPSKVSKHQQPSTPSKSRVKPKTYLEAASRSLSQNANFHSNQPPKLKQDIFQAKQALDASIEENLRAKQKDGPKISIHDHETTASCFILGQILKTGKGIVNTIDSALTGLQNVSDMIDDPRLITPDLLQKRKLQGQAVLNGLSSFAKDPVSSTKWDVKGMYHTATGNFKNQMESATTELVNGNPIAAGYKAPAFLAFSAGATSLTSIPRILSSPYKHKTLKTQHPKINLKSNCNSNTLETTTSSGLNSHLVKSMGNPIPELSLESGVVSILGKANKPVSKTAHQPNATFQPQAINGSLVGRSKDQSQTVPKAANNSAANQSKTSAIHNRDLVFSSRQKMHGTPEAQVVMTAEIQAGMMRYEDAPYPTTTRNKIKSKRPMDGYATLQNSERSVPKKNDLQERFEGFPDRNLPYEGRKKLPDTDAHGKPHTQLGTRTRRGKKYRQAREFDIDGKPVRDIDFTDHRFPEKHPNPHQHEWTKNGMERSKQAKPLDWPTKNDPKPKL